MENNLTFNTPNMKLSILAKIIDLLFPRYCPVCGNRLSGDEESICMSCNLHLPRTDTWEAPYENEMAKMFWHQIPIEKACALFEYKGHSFSSNILYQLKYNHHPEIAYNMGQLLAQEGLRVNFFYDIDGIIPIPLAPNRLKERGYNQSEEIAKGIAELTHLPIYTDIVRRNSFTESQTHKNRWQRQMNVSEVFELYPESNKRKRRKHQGKSSPTSLEGKHFLIIDDVCTTGATIISCCQTIMKAAKGLKFSVISIGWAKNT